MSKLPNIRQRIQTAITEGGEAPATLARRAGLHRNTLYGFDRDDWNPSYKTLAALEGALSGKGA